MPKQRTAEELALRDAAAIAAMSQLINHEEFDFHPSTKDWRESARVNLAVYAYRLADAMLEARSKDLSKIPEIR